MQIFSVLQAVNTRRHQKTGVFGGSKIIFSANFAGLLPRFVPFLTIIQALIILNNAL